LKKAFKHGVEISSGVDFIRPLWRVLEENLRRKFNLRPVHSGDEIERLHSLFGENIEFIVARLDSEVIAGVVLFITPKVIHAQYTATSEKGQELSALDADDLDVISAAVQDALVAVRELRQLPENDGRDAEYGVFVESVCGHIADAGLAPGQHRELTSSEVKRFFQAPPARTHRKPKEAKPRRTKTRPLPRDRNPKRVR